MVQVQLWVEMPNGREHLIRTVSEDDPAVQAWLALRGAPIHFTRTVETTEDASE